MTVSTRLPAMRAFRRIPAAGALALAALSLAACSSGPKGVASVPVAVAPAEVEAIAAMLDRGDVEAARVQLEAALRREPLNPSLLVLRQGIVGDAKADLGQASYPYMVAEGDTMAGIAQRLLGNRLKSYQLARYNDLVNPGALTAGQVLRIPGRAPGATAETERRAAPAARTPRRAEAPATRAPAQQPAAKAPTRAARDPAGARRARTAGLAALNKGEVAEAVSLLQRAAALDPADAAIKNDLARARRIAATVRARR